MPCRLHELHLENFGHPLENRYMSMLAPLEDVHLSMLTPLATTLTDLSLAGCSFFSEQALVHLAVLSRLTRLSLAGMCGPLTLVNSVYACYECFLCNMSCVDHVMETTDIWWTPIWCRGSSTGHYTTAKPRLGMGTGNCLRTKFQLVPTNSSYHG
jgi:hypothetical protein